MDNFYRDQRTLITGGLGFIGSSLARRLVAYGAKVTLVDSMKADFGGNFFNIHGIEEKVDVQLSDIRNESPTNFLVRNKDIIFNLAGTLSHIDSFKDPYNDLDINCRSHLSLLESCRKSNPKVKVVYTGTRGQYGKAGNTPVSESHPMKPIDINGIHKLTAEGYHRFYHDFYGIESVTLRLTNTYGPRHQMKHSRQGIINWFIRQIIEGEEIKLFGDGSQVRDVNYIEDVVDALLIAGMKKESSGEAFNLGGTAKSLEDIIRAMIKIYGKGSYRLVPFPENYQRIEVGKYVADITKINQKLGWSPKTSLEDGLRMTFEYYEKYKEHYW